MKGRLVVFLCLAVGTLSGESLALRGGRGGVRLESLDDYATCQSQSYSGRPCHLALVEWVKAHPGDAFRAGKLTRAHMNHYVAVPFFVQAFEAQKGDCADEDVRLATIAGLGLSPDDANAAGAKKIAFTWCKKDLAAAVRAELTSRGYFADNVCSVIKSELPHDKLEFCSPKPEPAPRPPETLSPGPDKTVNPYGKFFGGEGLEIEMATFEEKNADGLRDVLVRMKGADPYSDKIDGKVLRLVAVPGGSGIDYKYTNDKNEVRVRMTMRKRWGDNEFYEAHFGQKSVRVSRHERRAREVKPAELLSAFQTNK